MIEVLCVYWLVKMMAVTKPPTPIKHYLADAWIGSFDPNAEGGVGKLEIAAVLSGAKRYASEEEANADVDHPGLAIYTLVVVRVEERAPQNGRAKCAAV